MGGRLTQLLLALSLLLNAFVLAGFVYRSWVAPPEFERRGPGPGRPGGPLEWMAEDVGINADQRKALHDLFEKNAEFRRQHFQQMRQLREDTGAELRKNPVDQAKLDALVDQVTALRAEVQKENLRAILAMEAQLTPEQRDKLQSILAERFSNPPGRPRGPGRR
ncbi:MAG TPA: periplasmic heavy metal sensor [Reyranella sp.]|nr:periplasmic heavy metal sensor [Reyranella sp.]